MLAIVLGSALSVWDDFDAVEAILAGRPRLVIACNDAGAHFGGHIDGWVSLHPDRFSRWRSSRKGPGRYRVFSHLGNPAQPDLEVIPERWTGSSGLYGAQIALSVFGCAGAVLCGIPIDQEAGHIVHPGPWSRVERYRSGFRAAAPEIASDLRSMSGWTRQTFGAPDVEWLNERA